MQTIIVTRAPNGTFILTRPEGSEAKSAEMLTYETWEHLEERLRELGLDDARIDGLRGQLKSNDTAISTL